MHKGIICLTQAADSNDAIGNVETFLEDYGDGKVWDWYVIGGRWSGTLNTLHEKFMSEARPYLKEKYQRDVILVSDITESEDELQNIWVKLGGQLKNPLNRDQYVGEYNDDSIPLALCLDVVNEWKVDMKKESEMYFNLMLEEKAKNIEHDLSAYYAGLYRNAKYDSFSFESNVYDIDNQTNNPEKALSNPDGWFAVMIDIHN